MAQTLSTGNLAFLPSEAGTLIIQPVIAASVATQVATVVQTSAAGFRVPVVTATPVSHWTDEATEIPVSQASLAESIADFRALKSLVPVSNEAMSDMQPEVASMLGTLLAADIAKQLDRAYFGAAVAGAPAGIKSLTTTVVSAGGAWTDVDPFLEAIYGAQTLGANVTAFVANPIDSLAMAQIREGSTSIRSLLEPDPTAVGRRIIAGVPLYSSPAVAVGEIWAVSRAHAIVVLKSAVDIKVDASAAFSADTTLIRAVLRAGFCWPYELALTKITKA